MSNIAAFKDTPYPFGIAKIHDDFGLTEYDLIGPPSRFFLDQSAPPVVIHVAVDSRKLALVPTAADSLASVLDNWQPISRRSQARLFAWYLLLEDPQRRLEFREVQTLAHQASLVRFILDSSDLSRVLIADEVGLGKTVEAALIVKELLEKRPSLRVLYLAPARLVSNVYREFHRMELPFRRWVAGEERDGNLDTDDRLIASIHRAATESNFDAVVGTRPWDVIIVDECHHLSAYGKNDGKKSVRQYALVEKLLRKLPEGGRLILMSGTPHQGNPDRFENLIDLLRAPSEAVTSIRGRVIYRTKEDVRGWNDEPLFPLRQVNPAHIIGITSRYRDWLSDIHGFYVTDQGSAGSGAEAAHRAASWRCGQALQWAASSVQAGLGYLVRQAMRIGWGFETTELQSALRAIRPYRRGPANEELQSLYSRIQKEIGCQAYGNGPDDLEESDISNWKPNETRLKQLILDGVSLKNDVGASKWDYIDEHILQNAPDEQFVLFAQPIETVTALAEYLERKYGTRPSLIIGGQSDEEREKEIDRFGSGESRFLVSSRAGNEGINLQCARRVVHVDVPWNPMDLEQRVGRVHRFGSRNTIIVDTVVLEGSREEHVYSVAYKKLREITATLTIDRSRFEELFSRVMSLVPPAELHDILSDEAYGPLSASDSARLAQLVESGLTSWRSFHDEYHSDRKLAKLDPGQASWEDLQVFAQQYGKAKPTEGFSGLRFERRGCREVVPIDEKISVIEFPNGTLMACADVAGMPISAKSVRAGGINVPEVATALRSMAFPEQFSGPAFLRWSDDSSWPDTAALTGILALVRLSMRKTLSSGWQEGNSELRVWTVESDASREIVGSDKGALLRSIFRASLRTKPIVESANLLEQMKSIEARLLNEYRRPTDEERDAGIRFAVLPLFAGIISN